MADENKTSIVTKAELMTLIEDRKNDPSHLELKYDPPWLHNADDGVRKRMRVRERRIRYVTTRLDQASQKVEQEFDRNS